MKQTGLLVTIPFQSQWERKILSHEKTCTTRTRAYGQKGDGFFAFNKAFVLRDIEEVSLDLVCNLLYKVEGCKDPGEFVGVWNVLHPVKGYRPSQRVFLHWFEPRED